MALAALPALRSLYETFLTAFDDAQGGLHERVQAESRPGDGAAGDAGTDAVEAVRVAFAREVTIDEGGPIMVHLSTSIKPDKTAYLYDTVKLTVTETWRSLDDVEAATGAEAAAAASARSHSLPPGLIGRVDYPTYATAQQLYETVAGFVVAYRDAMVDESRAALAASMGVALADVPAAEGARPRRGDNGAHVLTYEGRLLSFLPITAKDEPVPAALARAAAAAPVPATDGGPDGSPHGRASGSAAPAAGGSDPAAPAGDSAVVVAADGSTDAESKDVGAVAGAAVPNVVSVPPPDPMAGAGDEEAERAPTSAAPSVRVLERDTARGILQLGVYRQFHPNNCGFHALHNASCMLQACAAETPEAAEAHLRDLGDGVAFWRTFNRLQRTLRARAPTSASWGSESIEEGLLNDFFAPYLVANDEVLSRELGGTQGFTAIPNFRLLPARRVKALQKAVFDKIASRESYRHAFLLGASRHWVTVVVNKVRGRCEFLFADSANKRIVAAASPEEVYARARAITEAWMPRGRYFLRRRREHRTASVATLDRLLLDGVEQPYIPPMYWRWRPLKTRVQMAVDEFDATLGYLDVITSCSSPASSGGSTLQRVYLEALVDKYLRGFDAVAVHPESREVIVPREPHEGDHRGVEHWVSSWTRPSSIASGLVDVLHTVGPQHLSTATLHRLARWVRRVCWAIVGTEPAKLGRSSSTCSEGGTPNVTKLHWVLLHLDEMLMRYVDDDALVEAHDLLEGHGPAGAASGAAGASAAAGSAGGSSSHK